MFDNRIPGQLPGEKIIKVIRRTLFVMLKKILLFIILGGLPPVVIYFLHSDFFLNITADIIAYPIFIIVASCYYFFLLVFFFFSFIDYYLDTWVITNERIIDMKQNGFFARTVAEQRLDRMQDVTSEVKGVFPTLLGFGDVYVQTAAEKQRFVFEEVPHPERIRDTLVRLGEEAHRGHHEQA
jgi:uncharacterized membrane protein YdbT with pleckstrin-like domain